MNLLTIQNLTKRMGERLLLDKAELLINAGDRIGLIGVNGSGKTTLLRMVAGLEAPDDGNVTVWGGVRVEYLAQEPELDDSLTVLEAVFAGGSHQMQLLRRYERASEALQLNPNDGRWQTELAHLSAEMDRTDGWAAESNAKAILTRLGITGFETRVSTLSGGQRKRVALARVLIDRADLLILDEPTNHIDAETIAWMEEYLATIPGALLMVTHDRYFLNRVVNRIVELDRRELISYSGNYNRYLQEQAQRHASLGAAEVKRQRLLKRELEWLRRSPMARGTKQKARKQRVGELIDLRYDSKEEVVAIALAGRRLGNRVLAANALQKIYGGKIAVDGVDLRLDRGDRIGIVGPNGAGKSTLMDLLAGKVSPDLGTIQWGDTVQLGYYDQRSEFLDNHMRVIEFVEKEAPLILAKNGERVEAAKMLEWFLFPRAMQWGRISSLSGGERRRLYLLRTLIHQPNVLFLDEPTNDLDIQTLTVLEEFLDHFTGCLVVISHDRYFLDRTVDYLVAMEDGKLGPRYPTPYTTFARLRSESASGVVEKTKVPHVQPGNSERHVEAAHQDAESRRLTWKEQRELEKLEEKIELLESVKSDLLVEMNDCGDDYLRLQSLANTMESTESTLDTALERWLELSELDQRA